VVESAWLINASAALLEDVFSGSEDSCLAAKDENLDEAGRHKVALESGAHLLATHPPIDWHDVSDA
jgi:hypothetical protein